MKRALLGLAALVGSFSPSLADAPIQNPFPAREAFEHISTVLQTEYGAERYGVPKHMFAPVPGKPGLEARFYPDQMLLYIRPDFEEALLNFDPDEEGKHLHVASHEFGHFLMLQYARQNGIPFDSGAFQKTYDTRAGYALSEGFARFVQYAVTGGEPEWHDHARGQLYYVPDSELADIGVVMLTDSLELDFMGTLDYIVRNPPRDIYTVEELAHYATVLYGTVRASQ